MKIKLDVGYRGRLEDLKQLLEFDTVSTVYTGGLQNKISNVRWQFFNSLSDLEKQASYAHSKKVKLNLAINASCITQNKSNRQWWEEVASYFKDIESAGVDGVIIAHPFLMELVKEHTQMQLIVSTVCDVRNGQTAAYFEKMGADVLVPSMNVNWNFKALKDIKRAAKNMKLRLLVNEFCVHECPSRRFHYNHVTHGGDNVDYFSNCVGNLKKTPSLFLMNSAIRPEDTDLFSEFADEFKIVSRMCKPDYIIKMIEAYSSKKYDGNFVDLFGSEFSNSIFIDNNKLSKLASLKKSCSNNCYECHKCEDLYSQIAGSGM